MSKKNGKIELLRFFFCIFVVLFHAGSDVLGSDKAITDHISFFARGRISVEFFFLVSGFLAAKSAKKPKKAGVTIGSDTFYFILRKIKTIFPYHIFAVVLSVVLLLFYSDSFLKDVIKKLPSIFFLQRTGISESAFVSVEWYICSMLFALALIYPLMRKNFDAVTLVAAPVASSMLIGYLIKTYGKMPLTDQFATFTFPCNLRSVAVVLLGCFAFAVCEKIKNIKFTKAQKILMIVCENMCWIITVLFIISNIKIKYEAYIVYVMALGITLAFSRESVGRLFDNRAVYFLGRLSLPVYLCQNIARDIVKNEFYYLPAAQRIIIILLLAVGIGLAVKTVCDILKNKTAVKKYAANNT